MNELIIILLNLLAAALFSGTETALIGLGPLHAVKTNKIDKLLKLYNKRNKLIAATLVGTNITIIAATITLHKYLENSHATSSRVMALLIEIVVFFLLAEVLPKTIFRRLGVYILELLYYPIVVINILLWPITESFLWIAKVVFRVFPERRSLRREDIFHFVKANLGDETKIGKNLLKLNSTVAKEVMTPLLELYSLESNSSFKEAVAMLKNTLYSRFPVYRARGDNIIGYVEVDSFLQHKPSEKIQTVLREALYFPESLMVDKVLFSMQEKKELVSFVVSEYGAVIGMITFEDIAELLVGDIFISEQQQQAPYIEAIDDGQYKVNPIVDIDDFNEYFSLRIKKEGFETLGGYLLFTSGRVPEEKDFLECDEGQFIIEKADRKAIYSVYFSPSEK